MNSESKAVRSVRLFRTAPHDCSYLRGRLASTLFVDPEVKVTASINSQLSERGFRRSGSHIYKPDCEGCQSCISTRILVNDFRFSRRHRRILNRNADLEVRESSSVDRPEAYRLYCDYINRRHADGDMHPPNPEQYVSFISVRPEGTRFFEFYEQDRLLAVSVVDQLQHGLSAVYTFYDPEQNRRSLGNFVILWQIQRARSMQLPFLYLGYWVKDCPKMSYKSTYRPLEMFVKGRWIRLA
ncbi:MAG: arginyltransferase [Gammaproteobacteria bacterium]|nr:arginyltransferase [Pseudomonadales bacterium]MCP5346189.1 arginyltransferase [Pseudomonadales bacterium]